MRVDHALSLCDATSGLLPEGWSALARRRFALNPLALFLGTLAVVLFLLALVAANLFQREPEALQNADSYASIAGAVVAAMSLLVQTGASLRPAQSNVTDRAQELNNATEDLTTAAGKRSREEEHRQKVHDPVPLPVRWHNAADGLIDHWENIRAVPAGVRSEPLHLDNTVDGIADTFRTLPAQRLVVLGKAGSGKTVLAHHLIHQLLQERESTDPVPVLFSLNTWDVTTPLRYWLVAQLRRDYDLDGTDSTGRTLAQSLIENDRILPVLDGFDEITAERRATAETHRTALSALNDTDLPMVLTSRPDEYRDAITNDHFLAKAAAIELEDLTLDDFADYLTRTTRKNPNGAGTAWDPVMRHLRDQPEDPASAQLRQVLTTPLMVFLARTIYSAPSRQDPAELLDTTRFPSTPHLEDHLLDAFIPAVYGDSHGRDTTRRWRPEQAQRWLGHLADHLTRLDTHDLAWWQLGTTLHWYTRLLITMITSGLMLGLMFGLVLELILRVTNGLATGLAAGLATGLLLGLSVGFINAVRFLFRSTAREPERLRLRLRNVTRTGRLPNIRRLAAEFTTGLAIGLAYGFAYGAAFGLATGGVDGVMPGLANGLTTGPPTGVLAGILNIVVAMLGDRHAPQESIAPWQFLNTDRTVTLIRATTLGLAVGLLAGLVNGTTFGLAEGLAIGIMLGFPLALARLTWSASGHWLLFARLWLPLTRRLPWRPKRFLEDAYRQGVLRQAGTVYQFRHAQLRDHLAARYRNQPRATPPPKDAAERDGLSPVPDPR